MSFISFLLGAVVGGVAMKFYIDKQKTSAVKADETEVPAAVEITADGTVTIEPSDKDKITTAIKTLQKARSRVSIASVVRESRLSNYKVSKHKDLIKKHKESKSL